MEFSRLGNLFIVLILITALTTSVAFVLLDNKGPLGGMVATALSNLTDGSNSQKYNPPQKLANPPEIIKAVYVTRNSASSKSYLNYLANLFKNTEINAVVVDVKDSEGVISYNSGSAEAVKYSLGGNSIKNIDELVNFFHSQNIYLIGRIAVFEDPAYAKARPELAIYNKAKTVDIKQPVLWKDNNGLSWLDPSSREVWDYNISVAKDALYHGFDEINFDYVRFPSDGNMKNMGFPISNDEIIEVDAIKDFFQYLRANLINEKTSVDLFGQTTIDYNDMGIGQLLENAFENFDFISPMVYPSHYANGFLGFANPAEYPYEVVKYSMDKAIVREKNYLQQMQGQNPNKNSFTLAKFRPWLQDFDMGADYNSEMVKVEIKATKDALGEDYAGFMLWNSSNIYTQGAVLK